MAGLILILILTYGFFTSIFEVSILLCILAAVSWAASIILVAVSAMLLIILVVSTLSLILLASEVIVSVDTVVVSLLLESLHEIRMNENAATDNNFFILVFFGSQMYSDLG